MFSSIPIPINQPETYEQFKLPNPTLLPGNLAFYRLSPFSYIPVVLIKKTWDLKTTSWIWQCFFTDHGKTYMTDETNLCSIQPSSDPFINYQPNF